MFWIIEIQLNNVSLVVKTKQLFAKTPLSNFPLKECLFGATNIVKDSDKMMYLYSGYGITFDG